MAEELALEQVSGSAPQLIDRKRRAGARAGEVDGARDQLLAGAALAVDQDRRVGARDALDEGEDRLHLAGRWPMMLLKP